ncbi:MAG TPA: Rieske 2Fe-2S domain-containing protein [Stellaceae bacterium]|jgi:phenylpropionate dioxygenase-like ring-hydroxylating dioxygenase large terminal subunit|nr:Rieske 2Fe-2S domain-containing protein [Stellaceae bacterium]
MLSLEDNELLTRTNRGTPGGDFLRRYWQPVALAEEMAPGAPPTPVRIMGEDLVLFRDPAGRLGLIARRCAHRGVDLSYGRIEDGGLRCLYHGWVFDIHGKCLEQPAEPAQSRYKEQVKHLAYPVQEKGGIIFAYLGPDTPPLLPDYPHLVAPEGHRMASKVHQRCNWVQALEGSLDPSHVAFLHRFMTPEAKRDRSNEPPHWQYFDENRAPEMTSERTRFGVRICALRRLEGRDSYLEVVNFLYPNGATIIGAESAQRAGGHSARWYVPIDDTSHWRFEYLYTRDVPLKRDMYLALTRDEIGPDYRPVRSLENRYLQDRAKLDVEFSGMGKLFASHDLFAIETQGPIQDRATEQLGVSDLPIVAMRRALLDAVKGIGQGEEPPHVARTAADNTYPDLLTFSTFIPAGQNALDYCREKLATTGRV